MNHISIEARTRELSDVFSGYEHNDSFVLRRSRIQKRIATAWYQLCLYHGNFIANWSGKVLESGYASSVPGTAGSGILTGLDEVLCLEELDPVIEQELIYICGKVSSAYKD